MVSVSRHHWQVRGTARGRTLETRVFASGARGDGTDHNNLDVRVHDLAGATILERQVPIPKGASPFVEVGFSDDGESIVLMFSNGRDRVWALPRK